MISTQKVLSAIKMNLDKLSYTNYLSLATENASYPFIVFSVISTPTEYSFNEVYENIRIQFSVYNNEPNVLTMIAMVTAIERVFEDYTLSGTIICTHKESEIGPIFNGRDHYWSINSDYIFQCQRDKV